MKCHSQHGTGSGTSCYSNQQKKIKHNMSHQTAKESETSKTARADNMTINSTSTDKRSSTTIAIDDSNIEKICYESYKGDSDNPLYTWVLVESKRRAKKKGERKTFKCRVCNSIYSLGSGITNIRSHFQSKHRNIDFSKEFKPENKKRKLQQSHFEDLNKSKRPKLSLQSAKQMQFNRLCAEWISLHMLPFNVITQHGFRKIVDFLDERFNVVSNVTIAKMIKQISVEADNYYENLFKSIPIFSATTDVWTSDSGESYSSLTISYIDNEWNFKSSTISCKALRSRHTGQELSKFLLQECRKFGIEKKVAFVTTDGASNARKQVELTAAEIGILVDIEEDLSTQEGDEDNNQQTIKASPINTIDDETIPLLPEQDEEVSESDVGDECGIFNNFSDIFDFDAVEVFLENCEKSSEKTLLEPAIDDLQKLFPSVPSTETLPPKLNPNWNQLVCGAHRIQLSVRFILALPELNPIVNKVRQTVKFFRRSAVASTYLHQAFKKSKDFERVLRPILDVKTRWGSTYHMLKRFLKIAKLLQEAHETIVNEKVKITGDGPADPLTPSEKSTLDLVVRILCDSDDTTALLGANDRPTIQNADVFIASIVKFLKVYSTNTEVDSSIKKITNAFKDDIIQRRRNDLRRCPLQALVQQVSTFLTPQFKSMEHTKFIDDEAYSRSIEDAIWICYQLAIYYFGTSGNVQTVHSKSAQSTSKSNEKSSRLFDAVYSEETCEMKEGEGSRSAIRNEITGYKANAASSDRNKDPLSFWKVSHTFYPHLAVVARFVFIALACSTDSERVFSLGAILRSKQRRAMSSEVTEFCIKACCYLREVHSS